jgi:hypothetical protein
LITPPRPRDKPSRDLVADTAFVTPGNLAQRIPEDADYVVDAGRPLDCPQPTPFEGAPGFDPVFTNEAMRIYRLTDAAGLSWPP